MSWDGLIDLCDAETMVAIASSDMTSILPRQDNPRKARYRQDVQLLGVRSAQGTIRGKKVGENRFATSCGYLEYPYIVSALLLLRERYPATMVESSGEPEGRLKLSRLIVPIQVRLIVMLISVVSRPVAASQVLSACMIA
jgi:hypothetical protein